MEKRCTRRELLAVHGKLEHCCASLQMMMHVHMKRCRKISAVRRHPLPLHSEAAPSCRRKKFQGPFGRMPTVRPRERIERSRLMFLHPPKKHFFEGDHPTVAKEEPLAQFCSECCEVSFSSSTKQKLAAKWITCARLAKTLDARANTRTELAATSNPRATGTRRKTWNLTLPRNIFSFATSSISGKRALRASTFLIWSWLPYKKYCQILVTTHTPP